MGKIARNGEREETESRSADGATRGPKWEEGKKGKRAQGREKEKMQGHQKKTKLQYNEIYKEARRA